MNETILIVDDEKEIADLIEVYLKNDGYIVHKFYNGIDALECIKSKKIDLAILDVMLPDIDGFHICQRIREQYFYPIIMLTAKIEDTDKIRILYLFMSRSRQGDTVEYSGIQLYSFSDFGDIDKFVGSMRTY